MRIRKLKNDNNSTRNKIKVNGIRLSQFSTYFIPNSQY